MLGTTYNDDRAQDNVDDACSAYSLFSFSTYRKENILNAMRLRSRWLLGVARQGVLKSPVRYNVEN